VKSWPWSIASSQTWFRDVKIPCIYIHELKVVVIKALPTFIEDLDIAASLTPNQGLSAKDINSWF